MKKLLALAVLSASVVGASQAMADDSLTYNLGADVSTVCGAYKYDGPVVAVDFSDLSAVDTGTTVDVGAGSATYRCNAPGGFTRTISSQNNGYLFRSGTAGGSNNQIAYTMQHGGGSGLGFASTGLTSALVQNFSGSGAFLAGQTGSVTFHINGVSSVGGNNSPGTTVFAGDYADVVTIAVTAN